MSAELFDPDKKECGECALHVGKSEVCASNEVIKKIGEFIEDETGLKVNKPAEVIDKAKELLQCDSEACILESRKFLNTLESGEIEQVKEDLETKYKVPGPADTTQLLNNFHIDNTMTSWQTAFPYFLPIEFQFIDFSKYDTELERLDIEKNYNAGYRCIGCVLNTDSTGGRGKHWICVFIDMRNDDLWTIEFFNSSGNPPATQLVEWMMKIELRMKRFRPAVKVLQVIVSRIVHQKSRTECGPYCLYYIYNRIKGKPYDKFSHTPIPDEKVTKFRKHLFRA